MEDLKSGSPPCGIYITITDFSDMPRVVKTISEFAFAINKTSVYEKNAHIIELSSDSEIPYAEDLIGLIQAKGLIAILAVNDANQGAEKDAKTADGICIKDAALAKSWRARLSDDHIIGLNSPDLPQAPPENLKGIDFQKLPADPTLIAKQTATTTPLICATSQTITPQNCAALAQAGATFINATHHITTQKSGVMQATINMLAALEAAETKPALN